MVSYIAVKEIGRGGFGIVEEVKTKKGAKFAMKTLAYPGNASSAEKADLRARFEREVKYQSAIDHLHVVPIKGKNLQDDPPPGSLCHLPKVLFKKNFVKIGPLVGILKRQSLTYSQG